MSILKTYSTLRIFSDDLAPERITAAIVIEPTESFKMGDPHARGKLWRKTNGWFFDTKRICESRDAEEHVDRILEQLKESDEAIKQLQKAGCQIDICSYMVTTGQGGPSLSASQMYRLGQLGIGVWWDVYFGEQEDCLKPPETTAST